MQSFNHSLFTNFSITVLNFILLSSSYSVFDSLVKRLGDAKKCNRKSAHCLLLQVLDECTDNPQPLLDRLLNHCLSHKNSVMKEQGLKFLVRALNQ